MSKTENRIQKRLIAGNGYRMQCLENQDLLLEGCKGVLHYEENEIRLNVGAGQLLITGSQLNIPSLERSFVQIQGKISKIEFI